MKNPHFWAAFVTLIALLECASAGQETNALPVLSFSSLSEGRRILSAPDPFVVRLSAFDRSARLKTDKAVSETQFLEFTAKNVMAWEQSEKEQITTVYQGLQSKLKGFQAKFPSTIYLIKTTGLEEGDAAYTRSNAMILPKRKVQSGVSPDLFAHELFHVLSRHNPELRDKLYSTIGFQKCGEIPFPTPLISQKLTNPDAPIIEHAIRLEAAGERVWVAPILFSRAKEYDVAKGGEFFDYLEFRFLLVSKESSLHDPKKSSDPLSPVLFKKDQVSGFFEQIGRNTQYTIHPEEILADNFMMLVTGKANVASPEIQERINALLFGK